MAKKPLKGRRETAENCPKMTTLSFSYPKIWWESRVLEPVFMEFLLMIIIRVKIMNKSKEMNLSGMKLGLKNMHAICHGRIAEGRKKKINQKWIEISGHD